MASKKRKSHTQPLQLFHTQAISVPVISVSGSEGCQRVSTAISLKREEEKKGGLALFKDNTDRVFLSKEKAKYVANL